MKNNSGKKFIIRNETSSSTYRPNMVNFSRNKSNDFSCEDAERKAKSRKRQKQQDDEKSALKWH